MTTIRTTINCPEMTALQFRFLIEMLEHDRLVHDTYSDDAAQRVTATIDARSLASQQMTPLAWTDYIDEQIVDKFRRRGCNPQSPLFMDDALLTALLDELAAA